MAKDINKTVFDEATQLKLSIFGECFKEWFPVFGHDKFTNAINIFDFFAGSGKDTEGSFGSPLILLEKAKGRNRDYCHNINKTVHFTFNEFDKIKSFELKQNVDWHIDQCKKNNSCDQCVFHIKITNFNFKDLFSNKEVVNIFSNKNLGKFIILDQYGFSQIDEVVFKQLISFPKTDFIFFISSSFINRFKDHPYTKKHIDTSKMDFEKREPKEIHRVVANYFRSLVPDSVDYHLHHFSIKKNKNYYGLIFGTSHSLGMEKFLKICWKYDEFSGEANYNIDDNFEENSLFYDPDNSIKKEVVKKEIRKQVLSADIDNNIDGFKFAMNNGCEPKIFTEVIKEMEREKLIERVGKLNYQSTNIHKVPCYEIRKLNHEA